MGVSVLRSAITLLAAVASVLLGLIASYLVLYIMGVASENATGVALARGLRRCGVDAVKVVRLNPPPSPPASLAGTYRLPAWLHREST